MTEHESTKSQLTLATSVSSTVAALQRQFLGNQGDAQQSRARRILAELRRSAGASPEKQPLNFELVLSTLHPGLSEKETGRGDAPSPSEAAAFHALTLFALQMQGSSVPAHVQGISFAKACGRLVRDSDSGSLKGRFDAFILARGTSRLTHARSLVSLLQKSELGFDYGAFARDLKNLEDPKRRNGILLRWGRDFALGQLPETSENPTH